jgi:hypothetical protein
MQVRSHSPHGWYRRRHTKSDEREPDRPPFPGRHFVRQQQTRTKAQRRPRRHDRTERRQL